MIWFAIPDWNRALFPEPPRSVKSKGQSCSWQDYCPERSEADPGVAGNHRRVCNGQRSERPRARAVNAAIGGPDHGLDDTGIQRDRGGHDQTGNSQ
jgi:hypothetical protein